jgi:hypothetical protein
MWTERSAVGRCVEIKLFYCDSSTGSELIHDNENVDDYKE